MGFFKLKFKPRSQPSPTKTAAERISRLLDAPQAAIGPEEPPALLPQSDAVPASSGAPLDPHFSALVTITDPEEHGALPRQDAAQPVLGSPSDFTAPAVSSLEEPPSLPRYDAVPDAFAAPPHLASEGTSGPEKSGSLQQADALPAPAVSPLEIYPAAVSSEERPSLWRADAVPAPATPPMEPDVTAPETSTGPELHWAEPQQDAAQPALRSPFDFSAPPTVSSSEEPPSLPQHEAVPDALAFPAAPHLESEGASGPEKFGFLGQEDALPAPAVSSLEIPPTAVDPEVCPPLSRSDAVLALAVPPAAPRFTYGSQRPRLFPERGFLYSCVAHLIAIPLLLLWPKHVSPIYDPPKQWELTMVPKDALYLPALGGGDSGGAQKGTAAKSPSVPSLSVAALSKSGVSYPGAQAIVSNPPRPTNRVQTILQPELPNPPELTKFVHLPNVVRLAENTPTSRPDTAPDAAKAEPSVEPPTPHSGPTAPTTPQLRALAPVLIAAPKLALPVVAPTNSPTMQAATVPPVAPAPANPERARVLPGSPGAQDRALIALSVMPAPPDPAPKVPNGEAHGQFAVVTLPNLAISQIGIGSAVETATPSPVGAGANPKSNAHDATGAGTVAVGRSTGTSSAGKGAIAGPGSGSANSGAGHNAADVAGGGMTIRGSAYGSGPGAGSASGEGKGSGPAPGAFAGMTIQGGEGSSGMTASVATRPSASQQKLGSYGITVVSTGVSGGGLADLGIFHNEPVFTVYINMATSSDPTAPSWTLEYAAQHAGDSNGALIAPPFPSKKVTPVWPGDLAERYRSQMAVIFVVIDEAGKVQLAKTMQSPSMGLNPPLLAALEAWEFHPASQDGKPIAVRALVGVPIRAPDETAASVRAVR